MNALVKILARSRLLKGDLDLHLVRGSMVLIFLLFGYQKGWEYEAQTLIPFIRFRSGRLASLEGQPANGMTGGDALPQPSRAAANAPPAQLRSSEKRHRIFLLETQP